MAAKNGEFLMVNELTEENQKGWCNDPRVLNLESVSNSSGEENLFNESEHRKSVSDSVKNKNPSHHQNVPYQGTPSKNHQEHVEWDDGSLGEWHKQLDCHGNQQCKSQCHSKLVSKWSKYFPPTPSRCIKVEERQKESTISPNCPQKNSFSQSVVHCDHNNTVESGTDLVELWDDKYDFELFKESPRKLIGDISVEHGNIIEDKVCVLYSGEEIEKSHQSSYASFARNKHRSLKDIFCRGKQFLKSKVSNYKNKLLNKDIISSGAELRAAAQEISETSTAAVVEDRRRYLMSAKENQCNEFHCDKPRINGFASTAEEINGHPEDQVKGHEVVGSSAKKRSRDLICDEEVISSQINPQEDREETPIARLEDDAAEEEQVEEEEEIPLGSEALSLKADRSTPSKQPVDKRLGWLLSDSANTSIGSDFSHNSDISLDMLLSERTRDPEEILTNLGFVGSEDAEADDLQRLPERFLEQQSSANGIDVKTIDLNRLLSLSEHEEMLERINTSKMNAEFAGQGHPQLGNVLASVMNGMKFLNAINQSQNPSRNSSFDSRQSDDSVLQHPKNREFLEKQGFYKRHDKKTPKNENTASPSQSRINRSQSLDASERRKKFHQMRSRNFSTQILESDESNLSEEKSPCRDSRDSSLFRSVTSMEYSDSFESTEGREDSMDKRLEMGRLAVQNNDDWDMVRPAVSLGDISTTLKSPKKDELIDKQVSRQVSDEIKPTQVLNSESVPTTGFRSAAYSAGLQKLQEMRKSLVQKSMASHDLDDDYEVTSPPLSKQSSLESTLTAKEFRTKTSSSCTLKAESLDAHDDQVDSVFPAEEGEKSALSKLSGPRSHVSFSDLKIPELMLNAGSFPISDKETLGGMGRMESIQSDSSGFAEGDTTTDHQARDAEDRVSSLGSSAESDQTSRSNVTVIDSHNQQSSQRKTPISKDKTKTKVEKVDIAVETEPIHQSVDSGIEPMAPSITYHLHQREDTASSAEEGGNEKSVVLTIELPKDWLNNQGNSTSSVVSHLYKNIGISSQAVSSASHTDVRTAGSSNSHILPEKIQADPTRAKPIRSHLNPKWASTPSIVSPLKQTSRHSDSSGHRYSKRKLYNRGPLRENGHNGSFSEHSVDKTDSEMSSSFDHESECSFVSNTDSYSSLKDEHVEYVKLLRLVNKPMSFKVTGYTPSKYRPNLKSLPHMDRQQYLEEESKLLQYALQKYKRELQAMETTFQVNSELADKELTEEEREELEEFQSLWKEVRREINEMEQLIANRLGGLVMGNDNFNPLLALEIIHKMTELIKEQFFQHQMSQNKDDEIAAMEMTSGHWPSEGSISGLQSLYGDESIQESLSDLKESILQEVRQELQESTQWLQKEMRNKERELNKLRVEVMSQSIKKGSTRQKHYYETDV